MNRKFEGIQLSGGKPSFPTCKYADGGWRNQREGCGMGATRKVSQLTGREGWLAPAVLLLNAVR
jgi:predicted TIM-barrel enzyme